jgi:hypothetical protein
MGELGCREVKDRGAFLMGAFRLLSKMQRLLKLELHY